MQDKKQDGDRTQVIKIIGAKGREAGKLSRYVVVTPEVSKCLEAFYAYRKTRKVVKSERLIISSVGNDFSKRYANTLFKSVMLKVGFRQREMLDLRRGCATSIINNPLYKVTDAQKQLGHKHLSTTMRYEHLNKLEAAKQFKGHN